MFVNKRCDVSHVTLDCIRIESTDGNFGTLEKSSNYHSHSHVCSSRSRFYFWHTYVPIPMGFPRESHSRARLYNRVDGGQWSTWLNVSATIFKALYVPMMDLYLIFQFVKGRCYGNLIMKAN